MATNISTIDKIPIYYRDPKYGNEMITGYLSKKKYKNPQSFMGHFKCEECDNRWTSSNTLQGCRQSCDKCSCPNWPFKVYHLEQAENSFDTYKASNVNDDDDYLSDDDDDYDYDYDYYYDYDYDYDANKHRKIYDEYDDYSSDDDDDDDESIEIPIYLRIQIIGCVGKEFITGYLSKERFRGRRGKRFYGHFRCKNCGNTWTSGNTWQGYKQKCKECDTPTWPFKVYHLEQSGDKSIIKPHRTDLCEKCQEEGVHCRTKAKLKNLGSIFFDTPQICSNTNSEEPGFTNDVMIDNNYYHKGFKKQFELFKHNLKLEPKFINQYYKSVWPHFLDEAEEVEFIDALKYSMKQWENKNNLNMANACSNILMIIGF